MSTPDETTANNTTTQENIEPIVKENSPSNETLVKKQNDADESESKAIERYQPAPLPANRPLLSRSLSLVNYSSLPGNRPIAIAHLNIVDRDTLPNHRPIIHSGLEIVNQDALGSYRPIIRKGLPLKPSQYLPNNRPIATNQIYDSEELMGYID